MITESVKLLWALFEKICILRWVSLWGKTPDSNNISTEGHIKIETDVAHDQAKMTDYRENKTNSQWSLPGKLTLISKDNKLPINNGQVQSNRASIRKYPNEGRILRRGIKAKEDKDEKRLKTDEGTQINLQ